MSAAAVKVGEPSYKMDKLSSEIFSILESKFLFGPDDATTKPPSAGTPPRWSQSPFAGGGRVRILSIDAGGATEGLLAASSLALLESSLKLLTSNPSARISDFFDLAAGSGVGGLLVSLLFTTNNSSSSPLLSAAEALRFLSKHHRAITKPSCKKTILSMFAGKNKKGPSSVFRSVLGDLTLRDTVKPVLIPCYDLVTGAPFVFSRADAVETDGYNFRMREVCEATMGVAAAGEKKMTSVDGRTKIAAAAVDGGVATGNPASAAITHVLNNKMEYPFVRGVDDLFLVSVGNGEAGGFRQPGYATPSRAGIVKIAGDGVSDMIDQAVAMAFGQCRAANYVRIQGREQKPRDSSTGKDPAELLLRAEEMLAQRNVESVLFCGKKLSEKTNAEKLDWAAGELAKENERRKKTPLPVVVFKRVSPRSSSSSSSAISSSTSSP